MWPSRHIHIIGTFFSLHHIPIWKSGYRTRHFAPFGPAAAEYSWREKIIHSEIDWHTMNLRGGDAFSKYNVFFLPLYVNISLLWCRIMRFASSRLIGYIWSLYSHKKWKKEKIWLHAVPDSVALIKGMVSREIHICHFNISGHGKNIGLSKQFSQETFVRDRSCIHYKYIHVLY